MTGRRDFIMEAVGMGIAAFAAGCASVPAGEGAAELLVMENVLNLAECELLHAFETFDPADWTRVRHTPSAIAPSFPTAPGRTYRIVSGSPGTEHFIAVDGRLAVYFADVDVPDPSEPGYFGFGVFESHAEYANLRVYRPHPRRRPLVYVPGTRYGQG